MNKIFTFILLLSSIYFAETIELQINKNEKSLKNIQSEIKELEEKLNQQINNENDSAKELKVIKEKIIKEKEKLTINEKSQKIQYELIQNSNQIIDSLQNNLTNIIIEKNNFKSVIKQVKVEKRALVKSINNISNDLLDVQNKIDLGLKKISSIKLNLKEIGVENLVLDNPSNLQFIFESETWNDFVLYNTIYEIIINQRANDIKQLIINMKQEEEKYEKNLITKSQHTKSLKLLNENNNKYEQILLNLNQDHAKLDSLIKNKELTLNNLTQEYESLGIVINSYKKRINNFKNDKKKILNNKKIAEQERQKIEYSLILKKEARERVDNEIKKLLAKSTKVNNSDIITLKGTLPWPIDGKLITKFGINTSETGTKFDYSSIELVNDEVLHITSLINPNKPNRNYVKKFQRKTMNMKKGDFGYGVFGPKTTKKWKEYNKKLNTKAPITAIHGGVIEGIYFIDPLTGVAIMVRHDENSISAYSGHIDPIVAEQQVIKAGQKIGEINKENILAFQLWINNKAINPEIWLLKK